MIFGGGSATLVAAGSFVKNGSSGAHVLSITPVFNNTGSVDVQTGTLSRGGGGMHTGSFTGAGGLMFSGGHTPWGPPPDRSVSIRR